MSMPSSRRGAIAPLTAFVAVILVGMVAFAVDMGYIVLVRSQLQNAADSGAMAGVEAIRQSAASIRSEAKTIAEQNHAAGGPVAVVAAEDVEIGKWNAGSRTFQVGGSPLNAVRMRARVDQTRANAAGLFFARVFGRKTIDQGAEAVATVFSNFQGFRTPLDGGNLPLLPFAMDQATVTGGGNNDDDDDDGPTLQDSYHWDGTSVTTGPDGVVEFNLYPDGGTGAAGNRGLIDIGPDGGKENTLRKQITNGISPSELSHHGGSLELSGGQMSISGRTGVNTTLKSQLTAIIGQPRLLPLFSQVTETGTTANYAITGFIGVRIVHVDLTGSPKQILVQPTPIVLAPGTGVIDMGEAYNDGSDPESMSIYSTPTLVQ